MSCFPSKVIEVDPPNNFHALDRLTIKHQLSTSNYQPSTENHQLPTINYQPC